MIEMPKFTNFPNSARFGVRAKHFPLFFCVVFFLVYGPFAIAATSTPSFSTGTGTYHAPQAVTISEATSGTKIYYTTNGTTPTTASSVYTGAITVSTTTTLEAMAVAPDGSSSAVASATFTITPATTPTFSTGTGTYHGPQTVAISEATSGTKIYYTTNGSTPTTASTVYTGPVTVATTTTLQAIALVAGGPSSAVASATYTITPAMTPTFSPVAGTYHTPPTVTISEVTSGTKIYYTTNGSTPTTASTVYTGPFTVATTTTLQAIALVAGGPSSAVASATFTIAPATPPTFSTGTGTYHAPPTVAISEATSGTKIYYTTNGSTPTTASTVYTGPITIATTTTLQAIAVVAGGPSSAVASATYSITPASTPTFSTGTGTYHTPPTVTISESTSGTKIYYTTDGSTPTTSSTVYTGPMTITTTTTLQAIALDAGGPSSAVASATFTIAPPTTPSFSTGTGTYHAPPTVTISEATSGTKIYYTTDGSTPTTSSTVYTGPMTMGTTTTLQAIALVAGGPTSAVASATYTIVPASVPVLSLASGTYEKSVNVVITDGTPGATIHYTTNGVTPTASSPVYSGSLTFINTSTFSRNTTLQAIAIFPGGPSSSAATATYTILSATTPIHSTNSGESFLGMNVIGLLDGTPWPAVPVGMFRLLGVETNWSTQNPAPGTFTWSSLDKKINIAQANGAQLLYTFNDTPPWAIATGLQITSISRSGGVVTVTTSQPHGLYYNPTYLTSEQSSVTISGVSDSSFNGTFALTGTPTTTSLTYSQAGAASSATSGSLSAVCGGGDAPTGCAEAPVSLASWDQYVTALVNHVGAGTIKYWELWNEVNTSPLWRGDPNTMVAMAADAKAIIKAVDPNAIILTPSTTINFETPSECATYDPRCGSNWMNNWLAAGGKNSVDGIAFHGYPSVGEAPEQIQGVVTLLQLAMNQNGVGSMPLIDTESSWGLNTDLPSQSAQVPFLTRHLLLEQSMGVQASFWYAYDNSAWGSLWSSSGGLNAVGVADQQIAKWIQGSTLTQPCAATAADPTTFTCGYSRPNGYTALAVWNTAGTKSFSVPQGLVQYHDVSGNVDSVSSGSVEISTSPILLETTSAF
jgi:chitobiase/beta-hexosaminidase-like protein